MSILFAEYVKPADEFNGIKLFSDIWGTWFENQIKADNLKRDGNWRKLFFWDFSPFEFVPKLCSDL